MAKIFEVGELSRPTRQIQFFNSDFGQDILGSTKRDITGYAFQLIVKLDLDDVDSLAIVDIAGAIVTPLDGTVDFIFTEEHTGHPPGLFIGEIQVWTDGVTTNSPQYRIPVSYKITRAVDQTV